MNKVLRQGIAALLSGVMLFSQAGIVQAVGSVSENSATYSVSENEIEEPVDEIIEEDMPESEEGNVSSNSIDELEEVLMDFLYMESPYLERDKEQNILVGINYMELVEGAVLTYENIRTGEETSIEAETDMFMDDAILFSRLFSEKDRQGIYRVNKITLIIDGEENVIDMKETGIDACFGYQEEVIDSEEEVEYLLNPDDISAEIVTIDAEGNEAIADNIEEAIAAAQQHTAPSPVMARAGASGGKVIVLDPGHDATHAGAGANGLREEALTLKIAQYCKAELEQYAGVQVYMTRSSTACPHPGTTSTVCNSNRVAYAKSVGASVYVSFHLNTAAVSTATGAEIYYPNANYNASIGQTGKGLAEQILSQLTALGLNSRGVKIRNSEDGSLYPDGSLADYYGVIGNSKRNGFPGIIIEHAFLTNSSDANFLSSEANLKKLGIADATGIAKYYGLSKGNTSFTFSSLKVKNADKMAGTFEVYLNGIAPAKKIGKVQFRVWTKSDKSDMKVYNTKVDADGNYYAMVSASKHKNFEGNYNIEAYVTDTSDVGYSLKTMKYKLAPKFSATVKGKVYGNSKDKYQIEAKGLAEASSVKFQMWYNKDGAKSAKTYKAKKTKNGVWYYNVPLKNMPKEGKYKIKVLAKAAYGNEKAVTTKTITYKRAISINVKATTKTQKKFKVQMYGAAYASKVRFEVWSKTGGKDDLKSYKAKKGKDGAWSYSVPIKKHKTAGRYYVRAYMTVGGEERYVGQKTFNVSGPTKAKGKIINKNTDQCKFDLVISNLSSVSGLKEVRVKTYSKSTKANAKWYKAKKQKDGTYKVTIKLNKHEYAFEKYTMEVYAKDNNLIETKVLTKKTSMQAPNADLSVKAAKNGKSYTLKTDGVSFAKEVNMQVWTTKNGKDDRKTYKAKKDSNGAWSVKVPTSNHKDGGKCNVVISAKLGQKTVQVGKTTFLMQVFAGYPIMGTSEVTVNQMVKYYKANATYPKFYASTDASTLTKFCQMYYDECKTEGVKAEVAFIQAMKETNFLRFGGDVSMEQFNFAGIGATGDGECGNTFSSVRIGIRAQVQHLKAYASKDALKNKVVDPRFSYVTRGIAPYVEWLGIQENPNNVGWATDPGYGTDIVSRINNMKNY